MNPTKVIICHDKFSKELSKILKEENAERILVVTGTHLYSLSGAENALSSLFENRAVLFFRYSRPNPKIEDIVHCREMAKSQEVDFIIGLGGGTAMDIAKAVRILLSNPGNPKDYVTKVSKLETSPSIPLVLIPTTAGTGSEITQFAVIYIDKEKYSFDHEFLKAEYCLLDAGLTTSLPQRLTAITAFDAFSQAVESYWSIQSTPESISYSKKALNLLKSNLSRISDDMDIKTRRDLLLASHYSGKAIGITRTTAAHAISYVLTSNYGIPHGLAVTLTLPKFLIFNYDVDSATLQDDRGKEHVRRAIEEIAEALGTHSIESCSVWISDTMKRLGLDTQLRSYNINKDDIETYIVPAFNEERGKNNPRRVTRDDLKRILLEVW